MTIGVDVYEGNGAISWSSTKGANVAFAFLRAAEATVPDSEYITYLRQCHAVGIKSSPFLFFHWSRLYTPESQAAALLKLYAVDKRAFPPTIDVEVQGGNLKALGFTPTEALGLLERCVHTVRDAIGVWPMIYTSKVVAEDPDQLDGVLEGTDIGNCPLWIKYWPYAQETQAVYSPSVVNALPSPVVPKPFTGWVVQQYQGDAKNLPGVPTLVDMNRVNVVQQGALSDTVKLVQKLAGELVVDGSFGAKTASRIRELQLAAGQAGDGIVGLDTWPILLWKNV